jgi:trimethylamine-N-oxide reductase (cytochrome c)
MDHEPETGFGWELEDGTHVYTNSTLEGPVLVYVKGGKIIRIEPLKLSPEDPESWTIEARGRRFSPPRKALVPSYILAERAKVYSPKRVLYPMKRVDFDPNKKDRKAENRGKSGYERISWEEALDILEQEITRVHKTYGPGAIGTTSSSHHSWGIIGYRLSAYLRFIDILGVTYADHNPDSWEGALWGAVHMYGFNWGVGVPEQNDLLTDALQNTEMIVLWSADPETTLGTYAGYESNPWRQWLKELGVKFVIIDPFYNYTAVNFADKWIAPRPGTDTALAAAIAYVWISEGTYDKEYVEKRTIGFEKFRDYIMGREDGVPKTPEWAERITGVPAREIRALAREWARKRTMLGFGSRPGMGGAGRAAYGHEWARYMVALQAMQGAGKPGVNWWSTSTGSPTTPNVPEDSNPYGFFFPGYGDGGISGDTGYTGAARILPRGFVRIPVTDRINQPGGQHVLRLLLPEAIMSPPVEWRGKGFNTISIEAQFKKYKYPEDGYSEIRMFWRYGAAYIGTMTNTNRWVRMYRSPKLEFVVNQNPWFEGEAKFADLILPAATSFERWDIGEFSNISGQSIESVQFVNHRIIALSMKAIEPLGESKSDYDIFAMVAKRLGFYEKYTEGGMTQLDWVRRFFERSDLSKYISWEEFKRRGYFVVPVKKRPVTPALRWFYEGRRRDTIGAGPAGGGVMGMPDGTGLGTQSGKIEFESNSLKRFDPNDPERPPVPHYIPSWEGPDTPLAKKYPLQLMTPHARYSFHTQHDAKETWIDEIPEHRRRGPDGYFYRVMRMNPADAAPRGIRDGDLVKVYNDRGAVICIAEVTERIRPGVVHCYQASAAYDPIGEPGESPDRGGSVNLLTPHRFLSKNANGMAPNSALVEVERWEGSR